MYLILCMREFKFVEITTCYKLSVGGRVPSVENLHNIILNPIKVLRV